MAYQAPSANSVSAAAMATMPVRKKTAAVKSSQNFDRTLFQQERTYSEESPILSTFVPIGMIRRGIEARSLPQLAIGRGMEGPSTLRGQRGRSRASMTGQQRFTQPSAAATFQSPASALSR